MDPLEELERELEYLSHRCRYYGEHSWNKAVTEEKLSWMLERVSEATEERKFQAEWRLQLEKKLANEEEYE